MDTVIPTCPFLSIGKHNPLAFLYAFSTAKLSSESEVLLSSFLLAGLDFLLDRFDLAWNLVKSDLGIGLDFCKSNSSPYSKANLIVIWTAFGWCGAMIDRISYLSPP